MALRNASFAIEWRSRPEGCVFPCTFRLIFALHVLFVRLRHVFAPVGAPRPRRAARC